jgi:(1->4)-alpha-D-glucan 1-alpha-D-glucosylmutase
MAGLLERWQDGSVKLALLWRVLGLREAQPELFTKGSYEPLEISGEQADHICAFARSHADDRIIVAVPRLIAARGARPEWTDTTILLPVGHAARRWRNVLTGAVMQVEKRKDSLVIPADGMFANFPISVLAPADGSLWSRLRE